MKTLKIIITGIVQGVFFRKFIQEKAEQLGLNGFIRNLNNGSVEVVIEGKDESVNLMLDFCKQGPEHGEVKSVEYSEMKHQGFDNFKILSL